MAPNTLQKLLGVRYLRQGDGPFATPASRISARLSGKGATGRATSVKLELPCAADDYSTTPGVTRA